MGLAEGQTEASPAMPASLPTIGILGGGQLGRMTIQAAADFGLDVVIAERSASSPAARIARDEVVFPGTWDDSAALERLAGLAPLITLENEFVDASVLRQLEALGARVLPTPDTVATVQDKLLQKQALAAADLPVAPFRALTNLSELSSVGADLGWPLMLKARRDGYDGYGNRLVGDAESAAAACESLGWPKRTIYAEGLVPFVRELAVIVVRTLDGQTVTYPVVESRQDPERHICRVVLAPAPDGGSVAEQAAAVARGAVEAVGGVGTFGVELFETADGKVLVNELAPRPHNSGHYTIEACATSQFANHVRAVLGLPLGKTSMRAPAAAMVNLLGSGAPARGPVALSEALSVPETYVHLYGKAESRTGRKMGHVTALGRSAEEALDRAGRAAACLRI